MLEIFKSVCLGFIQGLTEFLPISSTSHLLVVQKLLDVHYEYNEFYLIIIQLGSLLGFAVLRREFFFKLLKNLFRPNSINFISNIIVSIIPAIIIGFLIKDKLEILHQPSVYTISLFFGGIVLIAVDYIKFPNPQDDIFHISKKQALIIGLFQLAAFIPGVSRSGSTIIGGIISKLTRKNAVEYSFMLGFATIFAASSLKLYEHSDKFLASDFSILASGFFTSFIVSIFIINFAIKLITKYGLKIFGIYRIIFAILLYIIM